MRCQRIIAWFGIGVGLFGGIPARTHAQTPSQRPTPALAFETNQGQTNAAVRYVARHQDFTLFLTPTEAVFALPQPDSARADLLRMRLVQANAKISPHAESPLPGKVHYFRSNDPAQWQTNLTTYQKVRYPGVYPGVDLLYYGKQGRLEYDFIVQPGADPKAIQLEFRGTEKAKVEPNGGLTLTVKGKAVHWHKPVLYQERDGKRVPIVGRYVLRPSRPTRVGFEVAHYDRTRPLVIDPVLAFSTYLGGERDEDASAVATDPAGNVYVAGTTASYTYPVTPDALFTTLDNYDAYVSKFNVNGELLYSSYIGGAEGSYTWANSVSVDGTRNIYLAGGTYNGNFPIVNGFQTTHRNGIDGWIAKLKADGSSLLYSTFFGGEGWDSIARIVADEFGNAYVVGNTTSSLQLPLTPLNALQTEKRTCPLFKRLSVGLHFDDLHGLDALASRVNALVLDPHDLERVFAGTENGLYTSGDGGVNWEKIEGLMAGAVTALGNDGKALAAGTESGVFLSEDGGASWGQILDIAGCTAITSFAGMRFYAFEGAGVYLDTTAVNGGLTNLNVRSLSMDTLNGFLYAGTYGGGVFQWNLFEEGATWQPVNGSGEAGLGNLNVQAVYATLDGTALFAGTDDGLYRSEDQGLTWRRLSHFLVEHAQVRTLCAAGSNPDWLYVGTEHGLVRSDNRGDDWLRAGPGDYRILAVLAHPTNNNITYLGTDRTTNGNQNTFVAKLDTTLQGEESLLFSSLFAGCQQESGNGLALDPDGNIVLAGYTASLDFPVTEGSFQSLFQGGYYGGDAFVAKIAAPSLEEPPSYRATYLGGGVDDWASAVAVDRDGNAYLTGYTDSGPPYTTLNFPTSAEAPQPVMPTTGFSAFVSKLSADLSTLVYSTYLGGTGFTFGNSIAVDAFGRAFVVGVIDAPGLPLAQPLLPNSQGRDAFISLLNADGNAWIFSTYFGSSGDDYATDVAVNAAGVNLYVVGGTSPVSPWEEGLPISQNAFQPVFGGGNRDAFVIRIIPVFNPLPFLDGRASCQQDGDFYDITLTGWGFVQGATVLLDDLEYPTTFLSVQKLRVRIGAERFATLDTAVAQAVNPGPGGGPSNLTLLQLQEQVRGRVVLLQCPRPQGTSVTLKFRPVGGGIPIERSVTLDAEGNFCLSDIPFRSYDLAVKGSKWLQKVVSLPADCRIVLEPIALIPGDANNDNSVDIFDLATLAEAFNTTPTDEAWNPECDFNCDRSVDIFDLAILAEYFNTEGDP